MCTSKVICEGVHIKERNVAHVSRMKIFNWLDTGEKTTFRTGKQAALYLARVAPRQTVEHLVYEMEKQIEEHLSMDATVPSTPNTPKVFGTFFTGVGTDGCM